MGGRGCVHAIANVSWVQTAARGSGFFLCITRILGLELRFSGLAAGNFTHWTIFQAPMMSCFKMEQKSLKMSFYHFKNSQPVRHLHISFHLSQDRQWWPLGCCFQGAESSLKAFSRDSSTPATQWFLLCFVEWPSFQGGGTAGWRMRRATDKVWVSRHRWNSNRKPLCQKYWQKDS